MKISYLYALVLFVFGMVLAFPPTEATEPSDGAMTPDCPTKSWVNNGNLYGCGKGATSASAEKAAHDKNDNYCNGRCKDEGKGATGEAQSCHKQSSISSGGDHYYTEKCESCQCYDAEGRESENIPL